MCAVAPRAPNGGDAAVERGVVGRCDGFPDFFYVARVRWNGGLLVSLRKGAFGFYFIFEACLF